MNSMMKPDICMQAAEDFFPKIQMLAQRFGIWNGIIVVKIHEGAPSSFGFSFDYHSNAKQEAWIGMQPAETSLQEILDIIRQHVSALLKNCSISFGGIEIRISRGVPREALFQYLIRNDEVETLSRNFCPWYREHQLARGCLWDVLHETSGCPAQDSCSKMLSARQGLAAAGE